VTWRGGFSTRFCPGRKKPTIYEGKENHWGSRMGNEGGKDNRVEVYMKRNEKRKVGLSSLQDKCREQQKKNSGEKPNEKERPPELEGGGTVITSCMFKHRGNMG